MLKAQKEIFLVRCEAAYGFEPMPEAVKETFDDFLLGDGLIREHFPP